MNDYRSGELRDAAQEEEKVARIRDAALQKARQVNPDIPFVIDPRTLDDYCYKTWDYPGAWYSKGFRLPDGFRSEEELVDSIAAETIRYFKKKR